MLKDACVYFYEDANAESAIGTYETITNLEKKKKKRSTSLYKILSSDITFMKPIDLLFSKEPCNVLSIILKA